MYRYTVRYIPHSRLDPDKWDEFNIVESSTLWEGEELLDWAAEVTFNERDPQGVIVSVVVERITVEEIAVVKPQ